MEQKSSELNGLCTKIFMWFLLLLPPTTFKKNIFVKQFCLENFWNNSEIDYTPKSRSLQKSTEVK